MNRCCVGLAAAGLAALAGPALAHHSFAVFDQTRTVTLVGTVREFQWTNPHAWLDLDVMGVDGQVTPWALEGSSVMALYRSGWKKSMIKPGDKVTVTLHPLKSGKPGGNMRTVVVPSGAEMKVCCS